MLASKHLAALARMEAARNQTQRHLSLIERQIKARAERTTITEKAKARAFRRGGARWTRSDELLFQEHLDRLTFGRRSEIEALSRKLARQDRAIAAFGVRCRLGPTPASAPPHSSSTNEEQMS